MTLRSKIFDDIYFSPEDGLAETNYVFLQGNNLPTDWQKKPYYTICESGFGTGLNFLAAWDMFEKTAAPNQNLHFISFEKYPLDIKDIKQALQPWSDMLGDKISKLCDLYPLRLTGWHRRPITENIELTLIFDDINNAIPELNTPVNAWFLDGFAPSKNPKMWSDALFAAMRRCSTKRSRAATFTAAGHVKRGLISAGFDVTKIDGYGRKREMITAQYNETPQQTDIRPKQKQNIAVIGGGLGGCASAYHLKQKGHNVTLFECHDKLAQRASGNARGLINPRFRKLLDAEAITHSSAYAYALYLLTKLHQSYEIDLNLCGTLHLMSDERRTERFQAVKDNWHWHDDHLQLIKAADTEKLCGLPLDHDALYLADTGYVSPHKICAALSSDLDIRYNSSLSAKDYTHYDAVILAPGAEYKNFESLAHLPVSTVRGQVSLLTQQKSNFPLNKVLCYDGFVTPADQDFLATGATFQKWREDEIADQDDDLENITKLNATLPQHPNFLPEQVKGHRAALRTAAKDHFPMIGKLNGGDNIYCSFAHGSYGIITSLIGAIILADQIEYGASSCLPQSAIEKLQPERYNKPADQ